MATSVALTMIHTVILTLYIFTLYYTFCVLNIPNLKKKSNSFDVGQLKYLTVWNVIVQTLFFLVCVLNDVFGVSTLNVEKRPFITRLKDFFHATVGFPVAMFVGVTFWGLMFVDRELVLPKALDPYFPWWLNHLMHTLIMVTTNLEIFMVPRIYPKRSKGLTSLLLFMITYLLWMHFVYYKSGIWAYPIIEILTWPLRIIFYLVLFTFVTGLYYAGETINQKIWGNSIKSMDTSSKKIR